MSPYAMDPRGLVVRSPSTATANMPRRILLLWHRLCQSGSPHSSCAWPMQFGSRSEYRGGYAAPQLLLNVGSPFPLAQPPLVFGAEPPAGPAIVSDGRRQLTARPSLRRGPSAAAKSVLGHSPLLELGEDEPLLLLPEAVSQPGM